MYIGIEKYQQMMAGFRLDRLHITHTLNINEINKNNFLNKTNKFLIGI